MFTWMTVHYDITGCEKPHSQTPWRVSFPSHSQPLAIDRKGGREDSGSLLAVSDGQGPS
jgi:hypothetical protein